METLERSQVCRLCGKQAGMSIDIFGKRGNHVKKINMILPILVHEMDLLPKQMCHPCNYKLQEFHQFYEDCLKTDGNLKSQLSWMQGSQIREEIIVPMVQINNMKIKSEPFDYEEQGLTGAVLSAANMANYDRNHYLLSDKFLQISDTRCSRCGCFCGNRNYTNNQISKNCSTIQRETLTRGTMPSNAKFHSRDMIRRNLFSTEMFVKNPTLQKTEIPPCNETKAFFQEKAVDPEVDLSPGSNRLSQQNSAIVTPKIEISEATSQKTSSRVLRPRKRASTHLPKARSSSDPTKKSYKSVSQEIRRNRDETNVPALLPTVKLEASNDCERSLRPRLQAVDYYSKSKRRIPQLKIEQTKISSDLLKLENVKKEPITEPEELPKPMDLGPLPASEFVLKVEQEAEPEKVETKRNRIQGLRSRISRRKKSSIKIKKEILETEFPDLIPTRKNFKDLTSQASPIKCSNDKTVNKPKRKHSPKYSHGSTLCLRSQIGCLRNNKLRRFHPSVDGPKKIQGKNTPSRSSHPNAIKTKNTEIDAQHPGTISRHQDCGICAKRFASQELYRLHDCYNKRH